MEGGDADIVYAFDVGAEASAVMAASSATASQRCRRRRR